MLLFMYLQQYAQISHYFYKYLSIMFYAICNIYTYLLQYNIMQIEYKLLYSYFQQQNNRYMLNMTDSRSASDYAKTKIQQIRKKFGYNNVINSNNSNNSNNKNNIDVSMSINKNDVSHNSNLNKENRTPSCTAKKGADIKYREVAGCIINNNNNNYHKLDNQIQNRIKNIDSINRKISDMLAVQQKCTLTINNTNNISGNISNKVTESKNNRRHISCIQPEPQQKQYQPQSPKYQQLKYELDTKYQSTKTRQYSNINNKNKNSSNNNNNNNNDNKIKNNQHMGLVIPYSKQTQSIQLTHKDLINMEAIRNKQDRLSKQVAMSIRQHKIHEHNKILNNKQQEQQRSQLLNRITPILIKQQEPKYLNSIKPSTNNVQPIESRQYQPSSYHEHIEQQSDRKQTIKIAQVLSKLIDADQKLRYAKWVFGQCNDANKWSILAQKVPSILSSNINDLQKIFTLSSDEHNPFFQIQSSCTSLDSQTLAQNLLHNWTQANNMWQTIVKKCTTIQKLQQQYFNIKDIDLGKKGHISIQDIVCFVNLYTGKFYRNRDAIPVCKRLAQGKQYQSITYEQFLDAITK